MTEQHRNKIPIESVLYEIYARINDKNQVEAFFSTCFRQPEEADVFLKAGSGDEFVHVGYYQVFDKEGLHNYKIVDRAMVEITAKEKETERATLSKPASTAEEQILQLQAVVIEIQYQNRLKEMEML